jgi:hypothetical protein
MHVVEELELLRIEPLGRVGSGETSATVPG